MLGYKVMQAGVQGLAVQAICMDAATAISAAGSTQGTATSLTNAVNFIGTAASGSGVVLSSSATAGDSQFVYNGGANPVKVYPPSGASINGLTANAPHVLVMRTACQYFCGSATQWAAVLSA
jgi:hypothetical protein